MKLNLFTCNTLQSNYFQLSVTEVQLKAAEEERDTLKSDLENTEAGRDVLIKKAWETRDAAVKRKNNTEIELARTRIDVMQINSQLMEAIQQKVELSQQLDQWQQDMQELLEEQMNRKMKAAQNKNGKSGNESDSSQTNERKKSKLFSFLKLGQTWHEEPIGDDSQSKECKNVEDNN